MDLLFFEFELGMGYTTIPLVRYMTSISQLHTRYIKAEVSQLLVYPIDTLLVHTIQLCKQVVETFFSRCRGGYNSQARACGMHVQPSFVPIH